MNVTGCHLQTLRNTTLDTSGFSVSKFWIYLNIFQIVNDRVCDASIRSMLEEFQILNFIFRLYYEYHLNFCNELICLCQIFWKLLTCLKQYFENAWSMLFSSKIPMGWWTGFVNPVGRKRLWKLGSESSVWDACIFRSCSRYRYYLWNVAYSVEKHEVFDEGLELEVDEYLYPSGIKELFGSCW